MTCDERGCAICNASSAREYARDYAAAVIAGQMQGPDASEIEDAWTELVALEIVDDDDDLDDDELDAIEMGEEPCDCGCHLAGVTPTPTCCDPCNRSLPSLHPQD